MEALDPHKIPPKCLKDAFKTFQKGFDGVIDLRQSEREYAELSRDHYDQVFSRFINGPLSSGDKDPVKKYTIMPGKNMPSSYSFQQSW